MHAITLAPEVLPPALLRTELPTIVRERCQTNDQIAIWLAIRWLLAECGNRKRAISSRMLAPLAKCAVETVQKHLAPARRNPSAPATLIELGLLEIAGYEDNGGRNRTPIYEIPASIELDNAAFTIEFIQRRARSLPPVVGNTLKQLPIVALLDRLSDQGGGVDRRADQAGDRLSDQGGWVDRRADQAVDRKNDQHETGCTPTLADVATLACGVITQRTSTCEERADREDDQGLGRDSDHPLDRNPDRVRREGMQKEDEGHARTRAEATEQKTLAIPEAPPDQPLISRHPRALWDLVWRDAHGQTAPAMQHEQLVNLIAEWDARSPGFGAYWVARAILEASYDPEPPGSLRLVRWVLRAWAEAPPESWGLAPTRGRANSRPTTSANTSATRRGDNRSVGEQGTGRERQRAAPSERASVHAEATRAPSRMQVVGLEDVDA